MLWMDHKRVPRMHFVKAVEEETRLITQRKNRQIWHFLKFFLDEMKSTEHEEKAVVRKQPTPLLFCGFLLA